MTIDTQGRIARLEAYEDRTSLVMVILALTYLVIFSLQVLVVPMEQPWEGILFVAGNAIWLTFVVDLIVRTYLAPQRIDYLLRHPIDVLAAVVPAFRSLRVLRVLTAGQWLVRRGARLAVGRTALALGLAVSFLAYMAALAVYDAERGAAGANITTFGDAVWWAFVTMTTVGYGDAFPVTIQGRLVAVAVMVLGVSLIGLVSAILASGFVARLQGQQDTDLALVLRKMDGLETQVASLADELRRSDAPSEGGRGTTDTN